MTITSTDSARHEPTPTVTGEAIMQATRHWTDPITPDEIAEVAALVRTDARIGENPRFWGIAVEESLARFRVVRSQG